MKRVESKKTTRKNNFYLTILDRLKFKTNLENIRKELNISKQQLNYYLRELRKRGLIYNKGYGWWELTNQSKKTTKYDNFLEKDMIRGHAYTWEIKPNKLPKEWNKRLEIIKKKNINYKLVGAKETTPRIKVLGRKVWLCNNKIRIFDIEKSSYYGNNAIESRKSAFLQLFRIVEVLERKLGVSMKPFKWRFAKEHYALIKNDLAIEHNNKGIILRIKDDGKEWLLVDDSLGMGGELENVGNKAFEENIPMQKWWNDNKKHKFKVTPTFLMESINKVTQNQLMFNNNFESHVKSIRQLGNNTDANTRTIEFLANVVKELSDEVRRLRK